MDKLSIQNHYEYSRNMGDECEGKTAPDESPDMTLDIREDHCPITYVKTKLTLEAMESGQILEVLIKGGEPLRNVPRSVRGEGHTIVSAKRCSNYYRLLICKA